MTALKHKDWFSVDKEGLAKILERRGKVFALYELISNAWDTNATEVKVIIAPMTNKVAQLTIEDDDPEGFSNLTHAYTLFAESGRKGDAQKRGRFNLGEKLVLAVCDWASITTTTGSVHFDKNGRSTSRVKRERGSLFIGNIRMNAREITEALEKLKLLIPPIKTSINLEPLPKRLYLRNFEATLPTEISDDEGNLRGSRRKTSVEIYEVLPGETAMIYEMGVPVVETGDRWSVNVMMKVPLNMDRDNVTPAYLREVRTLVLNEMAEDVTPEMATDNWVREAAGDPRASTEAVQAALTARFGDKRVAYDPSDAEANKLAVAAGYTVVHGGSMSAGEWENARRTEAILPAGKVTPSPKPFHPDGEPLKVVNPDSYTPSMKQFIDYAKGLHERLVGGSIRVQLADDKDWGFGGTYGGGLLRINLTYYNFDDGATIEVDRFLLHEFSHAYESDHLSTEFAESGFKLGAKLKRLALDEPEFFRKFEV